MQHTMQVGEHLLDEARHEYVQDDEYPRERREHEERHEEHTPDGDGETCGAREGHRREEGGVAKLRPREAATKWKHTHGTGTKELI